MKSYNVKNVINGNITADTRYIFVTDEDHYILHSCEASFFNRMPERIAKLTVKNVTIANNAIIVIANYIWNRYI